MKTSELVPGITIGYLTVIKRLPRNEKGKYMVLCSCSCGYPGCEGQTEVNIQGLVRQTTKHCRAIPQGHFNYDVFPGAKFGRLTIIRRLPKRQGKNRWEYPVLCKCDCGNETTPEVAPLVSGNTKSCGCHKQEVLKRMAREKSVSAKGTGQVIPGAKFGRLTVIRRIEENGLLTESVECICECGNKTRSAVDGLVKGNTKSCGCLATELLKKRNRDTAKYGTISKDHPVLFKRWQGINLRCFSKNNVGYTKYGAVGVRVCKFIREHPKHLLDIVGPWNEDKPSLDRYPIHNGMYSCGQCEECQQNGWKLNIRWATWTEQGNNKGNNIHVTAFGKTMTKTEWSRASGISFATITKRIKRGLSPEEVLGTPDAKGNCYKPETQTV